MRTKTFLGNPTISIWFLFIVVFLLGSILSSCFYTLGTGYSGLNLRFGKLIDVSHEGLNFKMPFIDSVVKIDTRTRTASAAASAGTSNLQQVNTTISVNYHLSKEMIPQIYTKFGVVGLDERIIDPRIQEVVKAVIAKYTAEDLLKRRDEVKDRITDELRKSLSAYYLVVEGVQVTNFNFSKVFNDAIESKQTSEQLAQKALNDLDRIKVEAQQKIEQAKAEAEAIRIQSEAIRQQGGSDYVKLKWIEAWDGTMPTYLGGGTPLISIPSDK